MKIWSQDDVQNLMGWLNSAKTFVSEIYHGTILHATLYQLVFGQGPMLHALLPNYSFHDKILGWLSMELMWHKINLGSMKTTALNCLQYSSQKMFKSTNFNGISYGSTSCLSTIRQITCLTIIENVAQNIYLELAFKAETLMRPFVYLHFLYLNMRLIMEFFHMRAMTMTLKANAMVYSARESENICALLMINMLQWDKKQICHWLWPKTSQ